MMTINDLTKVLPPPGNPVETRGELDWNEVEKLLSTPLPSDYKSFIETYGTGQIGDFIWIYNPFATNKYFNLTFMARRTLEGLRYVREVMPNTWDPSYPIFPEKNGVLVCGRTDNGEDIFWQTNGSPDNWTIVVLPSRDPNYEAFPLSLTSYLEHLITGQIVSKLFPRLDALSRFWPWSTD